MASFSDLTVDTLTIKGGSSSDDLVLTGAASVPSSSITPSRIILAANETLDCASLATVTVAYDLILDETGDDFSWLIGDPTKLIINTAGLYHFFATIVPAGTYPAVGSRVVAIGVPGETAVAGGNPVYPTDTTPQQIGHQLIARCAAGAEVTASFFQSSGDPFVNEIFELIATRIG